jgi:hypothetical protein
MPEKQKLLLNTATLFDNTYNQTTSYMFRLVIRQSIIEIFFNCLNYIFTFSLALNAAFIISLALPGLGVLINLCVCVL